ncbi:MAG: hypothetical protein QME12_07735 [Nanoarchaeota archaeon]|nr:hypothetical protein [Nanoarchaeota archaeon]
MDSKAKNDLGMTLIGFALLSAGAGLGLSVSGYTEAERWSSRIQEVCPAERTLSGRINNVETSEACLEAEEGLDSGVQKVLYAFIPLFFGVPMYAKGYSLEKKSKEEEKNE